MTIRAAAAFAIAISIFASTAHAAMPGPDDMSAGLTREFAGGGGPAFRPISAVAEGDMVFVRSSNGDVDAYRIRNGKIVEHWQAA